MALVSMLRILPTYSPDSSRGMPSQKSSHQASQKGGPGLSQAPPSTRPFVLAPFS